MAHPLLQPQLSLYMTCHYYTFLFWVFFLDENAACIGICYHNKLQAMEEGRGDDYSKGWPLNAREFGPPCVGLCYMYRELNMTNPGDSFQHTGVAPTMTPTIMQDQTSLR